MLLGCQMCEETLLWKIKFFFCVKANVVCKQLGFAGGALSSRCCSSFGPVPDKFSYDDVKCNGAEKTLDSWY